MQLWFFSFLLTKIWHISLDTSRKVCVTNLSEDVIFDACDQSHAICFFLFTVTSIHSIHKITNIRNSEAFKYLQWKLTPAKLKANYIATSDVASIWLSSLPLKRERFSLTKRKFLDAVLLRYGLELKRSPHECVCKGKCNIDHALTCKTGGFATFCHNDIVSVTADMLSMVCKDVRKEPTLSTTLDSVVDVRVFFTSSLQVIETNH